MPKEYMEEYVNINGIQQYLLHYPSDENLPVMLYLHGGPGESESNFSYLLDPYLHGIFTVVYWDQRGAGKTYLKNRQKENAPTMKKMIQDLYEITEYLKEKYHKRKIVLLGHSWGSVLGLLFTRKYPQNVLCYIGCGQVINMLDNEKEGYKLLRDAIQKSGSQKDQKKLESIGEYPDAVYSKAMLRKVMKIRTLQSKYHLADGISRRMLHSFTHSPTFRVSDFFSLLNSMKVNEKMNAEMMTFNLHDYDSKYDVPIYFVLGDRDFQTPYYIATKYMETVKAPDKRVFLVKDAGHSAMLDQPAEFCGYIKEIAASIENT